MIDLRDYNQYKQARLSGDGNTLDAMETDDPHTYGIYERIFDYEEVQTYVKELDKQRAEEKRYQRWVADHGFLIKSGKLPEEACIPSFTMSGTMAFYQRYKRELEEGKV